MFPVRIDACADEDFFGFASRVAAANGFPDVGFLAETLGVSVRDMSEGTADAVAALEDRTGAQTTAGWKGARPPTGGLRWTLGAAVFSKEMRPGKTMRFCPGCVRADIESAEGRVVSRPYRRFAWCTKAVENCVRHMRPIVSIETDTTCPDFARLLEARQGVLEEPTPAFVQSCELDIYVESRIACRGDGSFLDGLEVFVVVEFSRFFGTFLRNHGWCGAEAKLSHASDRELGFAVARKGVDRIRETIVEVLHFSRPVPGAIRKFFDPLRRWLRRNRDREEFQYLAHLIQDVVEKSSPIGPGDCFVFDVVTRHVHTARTAAREYGIPEGRIVDLIENAELGLGPPTTPTRTYFQVAAAHERLVEASATLTSADVCDDLGLHEGRVRDILEQGVIARVEAREGGRVYSRIRPQDLAAFKDQLFGPARAVESAEGDWENVLEISRKCKVSLAELVGILAHHPTIERRLITGKPSFQRLLLSRSAMITALASIREAEQKEQLLPTEYLSLKEVRARLKTTDGTITELINRELLAVRPRTHLTLGRTYRTVDLEEVERFEATYISLHHMSRNAGIQIAELKSQLDRSRIRAVYTPHGTIARYYRREDLCQSSLFNHLL